LVDYDLIQKEITDWMVRFSKEELFLWINITSIHPNNQIYQKRLEFLLYLLIIIPNEEFKGKKLQKSEFEYFIKDFDVKYSVLFRSYEDFVPFNQFKFIPIVIEKQRYYFFYGNLDRPYEYLRSLIEIFLINNQEIKQKDINLIKSITIQSLNFQTRIIEEFRNENEAKTTKSEIYVPSEEFTNKFSVLFEVKNKSIIKKVESIYKSESLKDEGKISNFFKDTISFNNYFVELGKKKYFFILPQLHIEILFNIFNKIIEFSEASDLIKTKIYDELINRTIKTCIKFFSIRHFLPTLLKREPFGKLLDKTEFAFLINSNKLLIFKILNYDFNNDFSKLIDESLNKSSEKLKMIREEKELGILSFNKGRFVAPTNELDIFFLIIYEDINLNYHYKLIEKPKNKNIWIINLMDLKGIFKTIRNYNSALKFIKFLKNDNKLLDTSKILSFSFIDRFLIYYLNSESYPLGGKIPNVIIFNPESWADYYHNQLYEENKDDIYILIEYDFPNLFNYVKKFFENVYDLIDTGHFNCSFVVKYEKNLIWVMYLNNGFECSSPEIKFNRFIAELLADYLGRLKKPIKYLLKQYGFEFKTNYRLIIHHINYLDRMGKSSIFQREIEQLNEENPIVIITRRDPKYNLRTFIIYDHKNLIKYFNSESNESERKIIGLLIRSIIEFLKMSIPICRVNELAKLFIDENIPIDIKGYSIDTISTDNPKLNDYSTYIKISNAEIGLINKEISTYLLKCKEKPGSYKEGEAIRINGLIFDFLKSKLEEEIKKFDKNLLIFAYQQLEFIEGAREKNKSDIQLSSERYLAYNLVDKNLEKTSEISKLARNTKYIIEMILKTGIIGSNKPQIEDWHNFLAISELLHFHTVVYDYIKFDIVPYTININESYQIEYIRGEEIFDHEKFYHTESLLQVQNAINAQKMKLKIDKQEKKELNNKAKKHFSLIKELDAAFKIQYKISFINMAKILRALGMLNNFNKDYFPLSINSKEFLINLLKNELKENIPDREMNDILDFSSLSFSSYNKGDTMLPSSILRKKERLNLCPLIKLNNEELLYGNQMCLASSKFWFNSIYSADFPFLIEDNSPISEALKKIHKFLDIELEKESENLAKEILGNKYVEARIRNFKRLSRNFPSRPPCGEIDLLIINKNKKKIFVFDAKNRNKKLKPYEIRNEIDTFLIGNKSYLAKLIKKENFIKSNIEEVLKYFDIESADGWTVQKGFIVSHNYPSAFTKSIVDFILLGNLEDYIT